MNKTAIDCLAIPVASSLSVYPAEEAVLFGIVFGLEIGRRHTEMADILLENGVGILCAADGVSDEEGMADFKDKMNDIIEVLSNILE